MARMNVADEKALLEAVNKYLNDFPGDTMCALQLWYEGLSGQGAPNPTEMAAMDAALEKAPGWEPRGNVRYEKFGAQKSVGRAK